MIINRNELLSNLDLLNTGRYSLRKNEKEFHQFIDILDEKFKSYLDQHPDGSEEFLLWAIFTMIRFHDEEGTKEICKRWWQQTNDPLALIFHAYVLDDYQGGVTEELFQQLKQFINVPDHAMRSMINMYLGLYFSENGDRDGRMARYSYLKSSVDAFKNNVHGYIELGRLLKKNKQFPDAVHYFESAIANVETIYQEGDVVNLYSGERYIKEMILWSHCTKYKYEHLNDMLNK